MFLCQPLLDVLISRGIEDIDSFTQLPSWNDLPDSESIPGMTGAVDRVLTAVRDKQRIAIFGDYVECVIMSSVTVHTRMNAARCARSAPHNPDAAGNGIM